MSRTVVIRVGPVEQARREFKEDVATLERGGRVRRQREIWFANLHDAAKALSERRLALLRLLCQKRPRSEADLAQRARGSFVKKYLTDRGFTILAALDEVAQRALGSQKSRARA